MTDLEGARPARGHQPRPLTLYRLALVVPATVGLLAVLLARPPARLGLTPLAWVPILIVLELVPLGGWNGPGFSVAFVVQIGLAMLYPPALAGVIATLGAFDPRELRRRDRLPPLASWWNRCLALVVVAAGSALFHAVAGPAGVHAPARRLGAAWALTVTAMYVALLAAQVVERSLESGTTVRELLRRVNNTTPYRFPASFPGMAWFSLPLLWFYLTVKLWLWPVLLLLGLLAYDRAMCFKAWHLAERVAERNLLLADQARELATHLERERRTVAELQELTRLKDQFVAVASHEVRTPLTAIRGSTSILRRLPATAGQAKREEFLDIIEHQAERLSNLMQSLLLAAKLDAGELTPEFGWIRLADVCREALEGLGTAGIRVRFDLPVDLPPILTDRRCLCQILANLLENALKFSAADRSCLLGARDDGDQLVIRVQDHGIGIAPADLERIFERFYQVDLSNTRTVGGIGLGLAVVRELVGILGGTIEVTSQPGHGSCFTVKLPLRHPAGGVEGTATT